MTMAINPPCFVMGLEGGEYFSTLMVKRVVQLGSEPYRILVLNMMLIARNLRTGGARRYGLAQIFIQKWIE